MWLKTGTNFIINLHYYEECVLCSNTDVQRVKVDKQSAMRGAKNQ